MYYDKWIVIDRNFCFKCDCCEHIYYTHIYRGYKYKHGYFSKGVNESGVKHLCIYCFDYKHNNCDCLKKNTFNLYYFNKSCTEQSNLNNEKRRMTM